MNIKPKEFSGAIILDISEPDGQVDCWRSIKVAFVTVNKNSNFEYLLFDTSPTKLQDSAEEVLKSIENKLNPINKEVLVSYLNDLIKQEMLKRYAKTRYFLFKRIIMPFFKYTPTKIRKVKKSYSQIDRNQIKSELTQMISNYSSQKNLLVNCFKLCLVQKHSIALNTHKCETTDTLKKSKKDTSRPRASIQQRLEEMMNQTVETSQDTEEEPKTEKWYREACNCLVL